MPRGPRIDYPGLLHHVMFRGHNRMPLFLEDADRKDILRRFNEVIHESKASVYAWVLMDNHVHLLVKTSEKAKLARVIQRVKCGYAQYFNRKYGRTGTIYDGRYKSAVCEEEGYLCTLIRYIHLNPYRAGMVKTLRELNRYRWSGHMALVSRRRQPFHAVEEVAGRFSGRKAYLRFMMDGMKGEPDDVGGGGLIRSMGGIGRAIRALRSGQKEAYDSRILGCGEFVQEVWEKLAEKGEQEKRVSFEELVGRLCRFSEVDMRKVTDYRKQKGTARVKALIVTTAERVLKMPGVAIGRKLRLSSSRISQLKYYGEKLLEDEKLTQAVAALAW